MEQKRIDVGCYYFPNYHRNDERNAQVHGPGWSEWELVKQALPRFEGHYQPFRPVWGYVDESLPEVMERKIAAAADHGIDYFIFDYYYYDDGTFLENCLNQGFLPARNVNRIKFCLMWANHNWMDIHPCSRSNRKMLYPGTVTRESFRKLGARLIDRFFSHPSYYCIDGAPVFSIYDLGSLLRSFGGVEEAKTMLDELRSMVRAAGFPALHLNAVIWGRPILPGEERLIQLPELVRKLGFDSATSYVWVHHVGLEQRETPYRSVFERYLEFWESVLQEYDLPYFPNVTVGWDSSPRTIMSEVWEPVGYPYGNLMGDNTPANFEAALREVRRRLENGPVRTFNINCWNEWTEGSMFEPEARHGYGYLEAIRRTFPR